jgi:hypothetical protein
MRLAAKFPKPPQPDPEERRRNRGERLAVLLPERSRPEIVISPEERLVNDAASAALASEEHRHLALTLH